MYSSVFHSEMNSYRSGRAENVISSWDTLLNASTRIYNVLSAEFQPAFFEMIHHPILASSTLSKMWIAQGLNNLRASQARLSTNNLADEVEDLFEKDYDIELEYHHLLGGKWDQ